MNPAQLMEKFQKPNFSVAPTGQPIAVVIDFITGQAIIEQLEDREDFAIFQEAAADLAQVAAGKRPEGWRSWNEFEAELAQLERESALPA